MANPPLIDLGSQVSQYLGVHGSIYWHCAQTPMRTQLSMFGGHIVALV